MTELTILQPDIVDYNNNLSSFLAHLRANGRKETTIHTYCSALQSIFSEMSKMGPLPPLDTISTEYMMMLKDQMTIEERSKKLYFTIFGKFVRYCTGRDLLKECDILWNKQIPKRKFINVDEFHALLENSTPKERLVLSLGALCGLRRSEIARIKLDDICGRVLKVHGKGHGAEGKVVHMRLPEAVCRAIEQYLPIRANILLDSDHSQGNLIVTEHICKRGYPATSSSIGSIIKSVSKRTGVDMSPHSLRRLYATTLYDLGTDINTLRIMMRHEDVRTTMECYINPNPVKMDNAIIALEKILM